MGSFVKIKSLDDLNGGGSKKLKKEIIKKRIKEEAKISKLEQQLNEQKKYNDITKKLNSGAPVYEDDRDVDIVKMMIERSVLTHLRPLIQQIYGSVVTGEELTGSGYIPSYWDNLSQENLDAFKHKTKDDYPSFFTEEDIAQVNRERDKGYIHYLRSIGENKRAEQEQKMRRIDLSGGYVEYEKPKAELNNGKGLKTYKIKDGMFGDLSIDVDKLENNLKLEAFKGNKKVLSRKVDQDTYDILTKRYNSKKQYSQKAVETLNKLVELSDISPYKLQNKAKLVNSEKINVVLASPDELVSKFGVLIKKKKKNDSDKNMISEIADKLLELEILSDEEHKKIFSKYID